MLQQLTETETAANSACLLFLGLCHNIGLVP